MAAYGRTTTPRHVHLTEGWYVHRRWRKLQGECRDPREDAQTCRGRSGSSAVVGSLMQHNATMQKGWATVALVALLLLGGCSGSLGTSGGGAAPSTAGSRMMGNEDLPAASPAFAAHFTDPVYDDPADEFAPFGTDEGFDMVHEWAERRHELSPDTTVADVIEESGFAHVASELDNPEGPGVPAAGGQVDAATITIGAGFTLLRLTGRIDQDGRQQTLKALDVLIHRYDSPPQLVRQRRDLESWAG